MTKIFAIKSCQKIVRIGVKIVTSKMSYAQMKERVVKDSPRSKQEGRKQEAKEHFDLWQQNCRHGFLLAKIILNVSF